MKTKFQIGDVLHRKGDAKDVFIVCGVEVEEQPFCANVWYVGTDKHGNARNGLRDIVEECFEKVA